MHRKDFTVSFGTSKILPKQDTVYTVHTQMYSVRKCSAEQEEIFVSREKIINNNINK